MCRNNSSSQPQEIVVAVVFDAAAARDWGPAFVPAGITGPIELLGFDRAALIGVCGPAVQLPGVRHIDPARMPVSAEQH